MDDARMLDLAARLAVRAAGDVEPNPLVGAVLARDARVLGLGHHRRFGGPHAEVEAIADARARGEDPRGATLYVTLEPCARAGKQPPCVDAVIAAGIARVVYARPDPHPKGAGGGRALADGGVEVRCCAASRAALEVSDPFVKRVTTGLPWVIAKWAQSIDGRVATRAGESKWISGPACRRRVHRLRARVDAVLTGMGTARADDPRLTARDVRRVRRVAARVVADPRLELPLSSALARTAREAPVLAAFDESLAQRLTDRRRQLAAAGVRTVPLPAAPGGLDLRRLLRFVADGLGATNVLVEAGPRLVGALLDAGLIDECVVHVAPLLLGDARARSAAEGRDAPSLGAARRMELRRLKRVAGDVELVYRRAEPLPAPSVRAASPDDAPAIAALLAAAFEEFRARYTPAAFAATAIAEPEVRRRLAQGAVWVAEDGGAVVGTVSATLAPGGAHLRSLAVHPRARGRGVASLLVAAVERHAAAAGAGRVFLSTTPFLAPAIRLYEHLGYRRTDEGPHDLLGTPVFTMSKGIA